MSQRQQLISMQSTLEQVAHDATTYGFGLVATLAAAGAEAARQELQVRDLLNERQAPQKSVPSRKERVAAVA